MEKFTLVMQGDSWQVLALNTVRCGALAGAMGDRDLIFGAIYPLCPLIFINPLQLLVSGHLIRKG